jgi:Trypsin
LAFLCTLVMVVTGWAPPAHAIYNGFDVPIGKFPYMVSIRATSSPDSHICGGTLIRPDLVLTASHCLSASPTDLVAVVGVDEADWPTAPRVAVVDGVDLAKTAGDFAIWQDFAVLKLATPQNSPTVRLADAESQIGTSALMLGWGHTGKPPENGGLPSQLQGGTQRLTTDKDCLFLDTQKPLKDLPYSICASSTVFSPNHGDSGGPLLVADKSGSYVQIGVTSNIGQKNKTFYTSFASVPATRSRINRAISDLDDVQLKSGGLWATYGRPFSKDLSEFVVHGTAPFTWSLLTSSDPAWSLSALGVLTGTPTTWDQVYLRVQVRDSVGTSATGELLVSVQAPPAGKTLTVGTLTLTYPSSQWSNALQIMGPQDSSADDLTNDALRSDPCPGCSPSVHAYVQVFVYNLPASSTYDQAFSNWGIVGPAPAIEVGGVTPTWSARLHEAGLPDDQTLLQYCFQQQAICLSYRRPWSVGQVEPSQALIDLLHAGVWAN